MIKRLLDRLQGKAPKGATRSTEWPKVRAQHLALHPACAVCRGTQKLEVHHIQPFHTNPELELNSNNLITLCEAKKNGIQCHISFGHLGNYKSVNKDVVADAGVWNIKIKNRP